MKPRNAPASGCAAAATGLVASAVLATATLENGSANSNGNAFNVGELLLNAGQTILACSIAANPLTAGAATVIGGINFLISAAAAADACGPTIAAAAIQIEAAAGIDPNDKIGPSGDGSLRHFVSGATPASYQIAFENVPSAGLPAANVVIVDQLDTTKFDLSTVSLGSIGWGAQRVEVPPGLNSYTTVHPVDATMSVRVQGSLNPANSVLKWTFATIDPATGLPPSDPTMGFLPPDSDGKKGQGHVSFVVRPKAGLAAGTEISNTASIVFDANAPIVTPTWLHTLDTAAPTSKVQSLIGRPGTLSFDVASDSASDAGSAERVYTAYVSDNSAPFTVWQSAVSTKSAAYAGTAGHSYAFYVIATDGGQCRGGQDAAGSDDRRDGSVRGPDRRHQLGRRRLHRRWRPES